MVPQLRKAIEQAIKEEEESYKLYMHWYNETEHESARRMCERLAKEELGHKALLEGLDTERLEEAFGVKTKNIGLSDSLTLTPLNEYPIVEEIFKLAIKKEEHAHEKYSRIARGFKSGRLKNFFKRLASEENKHKTLIEKEHKKFRI